MKLNTLPLKIGGAFAVLTLVGWLAAAFWSGNDPEPSEFALFAASHVEAGKAEIRLRWMMKSGWLPEGGFHLYRSEAGGAETLLNDAPLGANPGKLERVWRIASQ